MDMNNIRTESHVAQKIRRHKLRFQQTSDDPTHQHLPQDSNFEAPRPRYGPVSYDPNVFPQEMLNSIAMLQQQQQPNHGFVDQETCSGSGSGSGTGMGSGQVNQQTGGNDWRIVAPMNIDQSYNNQDLQNGLQNIQVFGCSPFYQNTLQEVVTSATVGSHVDQSKNVLEMNKSIPCWMNSSDQLGFVGNRNNNNNNNNDHGTIENSHITQGLSLSLSSVPQAKSEYPNLHSGLKPLKVENVTISDPKQFVGVSCFRSMAMGPLGPFTGYATILKNSKYLEPAQELLSDSCDVGGAHELVQICDSTHKILEEMSRVSGESGASSSTIYGSNEHVTGRSSALSELYPPDFHHKKAKLIYMQEEVCRRYKQYHQQMQMVISSFETVAGLTTATPYISLALKSVSRHFHFVKNAISEQLTHMKKTFDDLCSPSKTFDANNTTDSLRSMDHNFQRHGKSSSGTHFLGNQQPVWRPQRGLPERAVSVLKAWLFDHFLHPYPSDADKHMLATQTGLTRNQVSNWFINARVRIWKPMVEEIHTLETKGLAASSSNKPLVDGQDTSRMDTGSMTNKQQPESSRTSGVLTVTTVQNEPNEQICDQEEWSRPKYQIPQATMDRSFTNMMPYPRAAFEAGGVGPVSLTLGLWQNAEHVQQLQQHEHQFRQHFGGQLIHDFVG